MLPLGNFSLAALGEVYPPSTHFLSFPLDTNSSAGVPSGVPSQKSPAAWGKHESNDKILTKANFYLTDLH